MSAAIQKHKIIFLIVFLLFAFLNLFIVILDHYYYRTVALDYAIYNFAFFDFAHLRLSPVPAYIFPFPATFLQDHFSLTLPLLAPLYWIMSPLFGTYSLLILQWLFICAGAVATYKLIDDRSGNKLLPLLALVYYFILFGRYSAYRADVNLAIIGASMIPVFLYYFYSGKRTGAIISFIFLLFNREDYALWLSFILLFLILQNWRIKKQRMFGFLLLLGAVTFFFVVLNLIIPALEDENKKYALFDFTAVGETPYKALIFVLSHPFEAIRLLFVNHSGENYHDNIKFNFYMVYIVSGGFLLFARPLYLLPFIPILAKKMYDDNPLRWSIETYYSIEFVSLMPLMVFLILSSFKSDKFKSSLATVICILTAVMTTYKILVPPPNPLVGEANKYNFITEAFYKPDLDISRLNKLIDQIPKDAPVTASCRLLPHLAYREKAYYFPKISDAEYVILIRQNDAYPLFQKDFDAEIEKLRNDKNWVLVADESDVVFFKRHSSAVPVNIEAP